VRFSRLLRLALGALVLALALDESPAQATCSQVNLGSCGMDFSQEACYSKCAYDGYQWCQTACLGVCSVNWYGMTSAYCQQKYTPYGDVYYESDINFCFCAS
jgi:hypothetical protein